MDEKFLLGTIGGAITVFISHLTTNIPDTAREFSYVVLLFLFVDSLTGIVAAGVDKRFSSTKSRTQLFIKLVQYAAILALSGGAALLLDNWHFVNAALGGIAAIEFSSIVENLVRLENHGVKLGPLGTLLNRLKVIFPENIKDDSPGEQIDTESSKDSKE